MFVLLCVCILFCFGSTILAKIGLRISIRLVIEFPFTFLKLFFLLYLFLWIFLFNLHFHQVAILHHDIYTSKLCWLNIDMFIKTKHNQMKLIFLSNGMPIFKNQINYGSYIDCIWINDLHSTMCLRSCWSLLDQPQANMFCIQTFKLCSKIPSHK